MIDENDKMNNEDEEGNNVQEDSKEVHWEPVAKLDPYEKATPEIKKYHKQYIKMWNITEER